MRFKIALRNVLRNVWRTGLSVLMIAGAVTGIVMFRGFADNMLEMLRTTVTEGEFGHLQVATRAHWNSEPVSREKLLIQDKEKILSILSNEDGIKNTSGRLTFYGLIGGEDRTVGARGVGIDVQNEPGFLKNLSVDEGSLLTPNSSGEVLVGPGVQKKLQAKIGETITAVSYTVDGVVNALDLKLMGVVRTGVSEIDNHVFYLPVKDAQALLGTEAFENFTIRLNDFRIADAVRDRVQAQISSTTTTPYIVKTWYELAELYRKVESFYRVQNNIVASILISLILLGILNTIGMTVYERTGEIGTIRALGETRSSVIAQFTLEGAILGLFGALLGCVTGAVLAKVVTALNITVEIPGASSNLPISINLVPSAFIEGVIISVLAAVAATWIPALRASKISIVEALRKNI